MAEKTLLVAGGGQEDVRITISHSSKFQVDIWTKEIKAMFKGLRVEEEDETYYVYIKVAKEEDLLCPEDCEMYCKTLHDEKGNEVRKGE